MFKTVALTLAAATVAAGGVALHSAQADTQTNATWIICRDSQGNPTKCTTPWVLPNNAQVSALPDTREADPWKFKRG